MPATIDLSLNQIVAHNIGRLRWDRRWSEEETAKKLGALLGRRISVASYSAMERSAEGRRIKRFDADEIFALARVFGVGVFELLMVPLKFRGEPVRVRLRGASESISRTAALTVIMLATTIPFDVVEDTSRVMRRLSGEQRVPPPAALPPNPTEQIDPDAMKIAGFLLTRPRAETLADEEKQGEELNQFVKELVEARRQRGPGPNEKQPRKPAAERGKEKSAGRNNRAGSKRK